MKHRYRLLAACLAGITSTICHAQSTKRVNDTLRLSLKEVWFKADEHSRAIAIKRKSTEIRDEEVKDAQVERYPELGVAGNAEKATNIPIYENGLFRPPVQHEVIHSLYRVGADMYLNIYNGNKQNLKVQEEKTLHKIALIQQDQTISDIIPIKHQKLS